MTELQTLMTGTGVGYERASRDACARHLYFYNLQRRYCHQLLGQEQRKLGSACH